MMARMRLPLFWRERFRIWKGRKARELQKWSEQNEVDSVKTYAQAYGVDLNAKPWDPTHVRWIAIICLIALIALAVLNFMTR